MPTLPHDPYLPEPNREPEGRPAPEDRPGTLPGQVNPNPPMIEPGDPGDAPSDSPTPTQA